MSCELAHDDGAYVLGTLAPSERARFQAHLAGCDECTRSVQELAGLPGLLGRVPADVLTEAAQQEPVPETVLPRLLRQVRRERRRRVLVASGLAAAAAVIVAGGAVGIDRALEPGTPTAVADAPAVAMASVGKEPVSARLSLNSVGWGTRMVLTCKYTDSGGYGTAPGTTYLMFVRTRSGDDEQVASWRALPGKTMHLAAATAAKRADIASVEIRTATGTTVLRLASHT